MRLAVYIYILIHPNHINIMNWQYWESYRCYTVQTGAILGHQIDGEEFSEKRSVHLVWCIEHDFLLAENFSVASHYIQLFVRMAENITIFGTIIDINSLSKQVFFISNLNSWIASSAGNILIPHGWKVFFYWDHPLFLVWTGAGSDWG